MCDLKGSVSLATQQLSYSMHFVWKEHIDMNM